MRKILITALILLPLSAQPTFRGFSGGTEKLVEWERRLRSIPEPARVETYIRKMSSEPHHAGSPASKQVAEYILGLLREWGLDATIEVFEALLPYPTSRHLAMVSPARYTARLQEPAIPQDADSSDTNQLPTYNAYSGSGDVTAPVVYVNYGIPEDYAYLDKQSVNVKGKIVIARYGKSWRGTKAKVAQERGAAGCLIYSDPRDDGYFQGDTYPKGAFRPPDGVQRGSVMDMPVSVGDPLSPGWASEPGSRRLRREEATTIMKIPVLPISYRDAQPLLENLEGAVVPEAWRGALPLTYHLGPGPATVRLKVESDWSTRPLYNVIATITGSEFRDQWIIYGNHHDAWVNGAQDPSSGAAALLETARALAQLRSQGWQPKRTIKLALWDAEEFGLVGSTEWVEKHLEELKNKAAVYINSDSNGRGEFRAGGSPVLESFVREVIRDIEYPEGGVSVLDRLLSNRQRSGDRDADFRLGPLGAGSDYVAFVHHAGIASLNLGFSGADSGGIYHSIYDSFDWYKRFGDPDFLFGKALAQLVGTAILRLADADVLPLDPSSLAQAVRRNVNDLTKQTDHQVDLSGVLSALTSLENNALRYEHVLRMALENRPPESATLLNLNRTLLSIERALTTEGGLPGRPWYKHLYSAPGLYTGYGAKTLPGVREAVESKNWEQAQSQAGALAAALSTFDEGVRNSTRQLSTTVP